MLVRLAGHRLHARRGKAGLAGGLAGSLADLSRHRGALWQGPRHVPAVPTTRASASARRSTATLPRSPWSTSGFTSRAWAPCIAPRELWSPSRRCWTWYPPEVLRYLIIRNKPEKHIEFDPALPLLSLVDEYDQRKGDERAIELSNINKSGPFEIPFRHMVTAVQIARGDEDGLFVALKRSGYDVITRREEILGRARNVQTWLDKYAPAYVKFQVQEALPASVKNLTPEERRSLGILAEQVEEKTAAEIHELVYAVAKEQGLDSKKFFQAIYLAFLGDRQGPKVGWFLASLERGFVKARLKEAAA